MHGERLSGFLTTVGVSGNLTGVTPSDEFNEFRDRSFAFLKGYPRGIPADVLVQDVKGGDLDAALFAVGLLQVWLEDERTRTVYEARIDGRSWGWIASRLGTSRQALWERYRDTDDARPDTD